MACQFSTSPLNSCLTGAVTGICNPADVTAVIRNTPYWKQMYIPEQVTVPVLKPDIESINSVDITTKIIRKEVIITPSSTTPNLEGKSLSGRKLIVEGVLQQTINYTALDTLQSVHTFHSYIPFSSYIVVPAQIDFGTPDSPNIVDSLYINFEVNACVEDVSVSLLSPTQILKQVTLLLYAVPTRS